MECMNCGTELGAHHVTLHAPTTGDTEGEYCERCAGLALRGWFRDRARFLAEHRDHAFRYPGAREVQELVTRSGSYFFSDSTVRYFNSSTGACYGRRDEGRHGTIYFATGERRPGDARRYTVRRLDLSTCELSEPAEAGGFQGCGTLAQAERHAARLAAGEPLDGRRGCKKVVAA